MEQNLQNIGPQTEATELLTANENSKTAQKKTSFEISCEILKIINAGYTNPSEIINQNIPSENLKLRLENLVAFGRIRKVKKNSSLHYAITPDGKALLNKYEEMEQILRRIEKRRKILQAFTIPKR